MIQVGPFHPLNLEKGEKSVREMSKKGRFEILEA
jgi:hypothetical protein